MAEKIINNIKLPNGEVCKIGGASGFELFDTILKVHILTYEQTKGWALQGTYVYKEAGAGSRYGYPDFYAKCLEEYAEATEMAGIPWIQPVLSANGTMGGNSFAVSSNRTQLSGSDVYRAFDDLAFNNIALFHTEQGVTTGYIDIYNPIPLNITNFKIYNQDVANRASSAGIIYGSDNGSDWTQITTYTNSVQTVNDTWNISLSSNTKYYKYYRIESTAGGSDPYWTISEIKITATQQLCVKNPNGHLFYDIADKASIDEIYNTYGIAWYYGIDTENERVFLPRTKWFIQPTGEITEVNSVNEAGLPNIEGSYTTYASTNNPAQNVTGAFSGTFVSGSGKSSSASGSGDINVIFDASNSNPIYGNSDKVQPPSINQLLYICVGNTNVESAVTDVVDVTTTENDTMPLFTGMYFDFTPNNVSWLKAGEQANSGGIYTFTYNELVNILNGETKYGDLKVINVADMEVGVDYSEYWKVNQEDMYFITPTAISNKALSGGVISNGEAFVLNTGVTDTIPSSVSPNNYIGFLYQNPDGRWQTSGSGGIGAIVGQSGLVAEQSTSQLYFKVANAVQNLELLDAGEVLEAVNNVVPNNRELITGWSFPSDRYIDLTLNASGSTYTAPANGWVACVLDFNAGGNMSMQTSYLFDWHQGNSSAGSYAGGIIPVAKGSKFLINYSNRRGTVVFRFVYAQGEV